MLFPIFLTNSLNIINERLTGGKWLNYIPGWWYTYPSEKYEFGSWDDEIPNIWNNRIHVPNHQPVIATENHHLFHIKVKHRTTYKGNHRNEYF
jgi:hypothetical protein